MALSPALKKKIAEAKATGGGNNINDGRYVFEIHRLLVDAKFKGTMFIAEFGVVESEPVIAGTEPNKPGTTCSNVMNMDSNVSAGGNIKVLVMAIENYDEATADEPALGPPDPTGTRHPIVEGGIVVKRWMADLDRLTDASQPARGMLLGDETYRKTIQTGNNAGKPFTGHKWVHIPDQSAAQIATRRKLIDAGTIGAPVEEEAETPPAAGAAGAAAGGAPA